MKNLVVRYSVHYQYGFVTTLVRAWANFCLLLLHKGLRPAESVHPTRLVPVLPGPGHIIYFPGPGLPGLEFCWPGAGPARLYCRDLENPGYPSCSAYLNYISRNMQYLPIKFT